MVTNLIRYMTMESPVGPLTLFSSGDALVRLSFNDGAKGDDLRWIARYFDEPPVEQGEGDVLRAVREQLEEYFAGSRREFDLPVALHGTPFQLGVWDRLRAIPYGEVMSYGDLAGEVDGVARAVGTANGSNPISIIVPCHRVIAADGSLCGYGGGLAAKEYLLRLEGARFIPPPPSLF